MCSINPYRSNLIPGFDEVVEAASDAGALGITLSGAGPTVAAFCLDNMEIVGKQMQSAFMKHNISCDIKVIRADQEGACVWTHDEENR